MILKYLFKALVILGISLVGALNVRAAITSFINREWYLFGFSLFMAAWMLFMVAKWTFMD